MFSIENINNPETLELNSKLSSELPFSHFENIDLSLLEKMPLKESVKYISENYYLTFIKGHPGLLRAFLEVFNGAGKNLFEKYYSDYIYNSIQMKKNIPSIYAFMNERVFFGREYHMNQAIEKENSPFECFSEVKELEKAPSMEIQASKIKEYFETVPELSYENWIKLDTITKLAKLNNLENKVAEIAHRPVMEVKMEEMKEKLFGYCNSSGLFLSQTIINSNSKEDYYHTLNTLFHEGRHAYQNYNLYCKQIEQNHEMINAWKINHDKLGYKNGEWLIFKERGYYEYYSQPVEVDARVFSEEVMKKLGF